MKTGMAAMALDSAKNITTRRITARSDQMHSDTSMHSDNMHSAQMNSTPRFASTADHIRTTGIGGAAAAHTTQAAFASCCK